MKRYHLHYVSVPSVITSNIKIVMLKRIVRKIIIYMNLGRANFALLNNISKITL